VTSAADSTAAHSRLRSWWIHGTALALLFAVILVAFRGDVAAAVEVWWLYPTYSHCFLIIPIALWLVWEKRDELGAMTPAVDFRALWFAPLFLLMWLAGQILTVNEVHQFAVIGFMEVAIGATLGLHVYRKLWFPALYLFFLVPSGGYLIAPMQHFAASFVDVALSVIGIPHHVEGTLFELSNGSFEIAEACAGLRFLIATVALGVLFAYMVFRKWYKVVLFLVACVVVPLIGNALRIVGIMLLAHFTSNEYGVGADHLVYGWGFNVAILLILLLLGSFFRDSPEEPKIVAAGDAAADGLPRVAGMFVLAAILISIGPAWAVWHDHRVFKPATASLTAPLHMPGWEVDSIDDNWEPSYPQTDAHLKLFLVPNGDLADSAVDLYLAYYGQSGGAHTLTAHINYLWDDKLWTQVRSSTASANLNGHPIAWQETIIASSVGRRMIWSTFWVDGTFTASPLTVKLLQARGILEGHEGQALIAVSTAVSGTDDEARRSLTHALAALGELQPRLDATNSQ